MTKQRRGEIRAIPIWQTKRDRRLFVLALIELARELVEADEADRGSETNHG